jgi:hypothetical protein
MPQSISRPIPHVTLVKKYTKSEKVEVLSPDQHQKVGQELRKRGKKSAEGLNAQDRANVLSGPIHPTK